MVKATLHRDRRSLRKRARQVSKQSNSHTKRTLLYLSHIFQVLAEFRTSIAKRDCNPSFGQSFEVDVATAEYKVGQEVVHRVFLSCGSELETCA